MGILLSKNGNHFNGQSTVEEPNRCHQSTAKRKRDSAIGSDHAVTRKKRKHLKVSHSKLAPSFRDVAFKNENGVTDDGNATEQRLVIADAINCTKPSETLMSPPKKSRKRKRKSKDTILSEQKSTTPQPNSDTHLTNMENKVTTPKGSPRPFNLEIEGIETSRTTPKPRRKRKPPTSPYFDTPDTQLSSSPATPTPSVRRDTSKKRSKISIVETALMPTSLPHFRPTSPNEFGLIQEKLRHEPWKMLVAVIFLNVTTAKMALPLLGQLFERWPSPESLSQGISHDVSSNLADFEELSAFLYPIGLYNTRARRLIDFSTMWLANPPQHDILTKRKGLTKYPATAISHLPGVVPSKSLTNDRWVFTP
jgi:endonuclease III